MPTGRCLIVVTPDAQRTMNTYLGVSELLGPDDVDTDLIASAKVTYLEGYLWDKPEGMAAYRKAAEAAHAAGGRVSLTLSDSFCVARHREEFLDLVESQVDVLFANEAEITELYEVGSFDDALQTGAPPLRDRGAHPIGEGLGDRRRRRGARDRRASDAGGRHHRRRRPVRRRASCTGSPTTCR